MRRKVRLEPLAPERALRELGSALEYALRHPTLSQDGTLKFRARSIDASDPIRRGGASCPRSKHGLYTVRNLVRLTGLMRAQTEELG